MYTLSYFKKLVLKEYKPSTIFELYKMIIDSFLESSEHKKKPIQIKYS